MFLNDGNGLFFFKGNPRFVFPSLLIMRSVLCANTQCHFQIAARPTETHHLEIILNPFVSWCRVL